MAVLLPLLCATLASGGTFPVIAVNVLLQPHTLSTALLPVNGGARSSIALRFCEIQRRRCRLPPPPCCAVQPLRRATPDTGPVPLLNRRWWCRSWYVCYPVHRSTVVYQLLCVRRAGVGAGDDAEQPV